MSWTAVQRLRMGYATDVVLTPDASGNIAATVTGLTRFTEYYYRAYVKLDGSYYFGETVTFKTLDEPIPDFVDLGFSVLWAGKNLGAASPEIRGTQVAWGKITSKEFYSTGIEQKNYLRSVGHVGEGKGSMVRPVKNK